MKFRRFVTGLIVMCLASAGCGASRQTKVIGGTAMAAAGGLLVAWSPDARCSNADGSQDGATDVCTALIAEPMNIAADIVSTAIGVGLIAVGGGLLISATASRNAEPAPTPIARVEDSAPTKFIPVPVGGPPTPAELAIRSRLENRLAIQASVSARAGQCSAAVMTANQLAGRDHEMFATLVASDADLARCYDR